jgi:hypothetical protein
MNGKRKWTFACLSGLALLTAGASSQAALVMTLSTDHAPAGGSGAYTPPSPTFTPSSTDLLEGKTATLAYFHSTTGLPATGDNGTAENSGGPSVWTDGSVTTTYATGNTAVDHAAYGTVDGYTGNEDTNTYVTFDLGGLYNLTTADIFQGWNDSGRDSFSFVLQTSADGVNYTNVGTYLKGPDDTGVYSTPVTNKIDFADSVGGSIATGVEFVRLDVTDADNGYAGLSEVDVTGTPAAVPEPASLGLLGMGALTLLRRRR